MSSDIANATKLPQGLRPERAIIHTLHTNGKWTKKSTQVAIEAKPFAEGSFRRAYISYLLRDNQWQKFVCKFAKDKNTPRQLYFKDIEAQVFAMVWAKKYNKYDPPKRVEFALCFVLELVDRPGRPVCGSEIYISGQFMKHNNNVGAVCTGAAGGPAVEPAVEMDRKTAQAFSHFTYDASQGQILICDIQGVQGIYTDPQIHTVNGKGFGSGNLGHTGIRAFLLRHVCNEVCRAVGLEKIQAKALSSGKVVDRKGASFKFTTLSDGTNKQQQSSIVPRGQSKRSMTSSTSSSSSILTNHTSAAAGNTSASKRTAKSSNGASNIQSHSVTSSVSLPNRPSLSSSSKSIEESRTKSTATASLTIQPPPRNKDTRSPSIMDEADEKLMNSILNGLSM